MEGHVEKMAGEITEAIQECALATAGKDAKKGKEKLKPNTKELLKKRREMAGKDQSAREKIEYSELCKTIRKSMREDIREHNTMRIREAIESGRGLQKATNSREGCKVLIPSLKEQDGTVTTNRERILERCVEFYENLYKDAAQNIVQKEAEEVPPILNSEIEHAMQKMKKRKAPGEDQVVIEMLKAGGDIVKEKIRELFNIVIRREQVPKEWKKCHHHTDFQEGRQERPRKLQTDQFALFALILDLISHLMLLSYLEIRMSLPV